MSEAASAGVSAGTSAGSISSSGQSTTSAASSGASQGQSQSQTVGLGHQANQGQRVSETQNQVDSQNQAADELEEIALGSTKGRVPKEIAKAIKDFERGVQAKFREAAEQRRKLEEFNNYDIDSFAKFKGLDLDSLAEERLAKKYELMQMSPEQRRLHELETREQMRSQHEAQVRSQLVDQIKEFTPDLPPGIDQASPEQLQHYLGQVKHLYTMTEQQMERDFVDAWKTTGLPKTPFIGARMAFMMKNGKNDNGEPLQIPEAAARVKEAYVNDLRDFMGPMDGKALHDLFGAEVIQKIRDFDVQRVTGQAASQPVQNQSPAPKAASEKKYLNQTEWRKAMGLA